jgi:hypothetical protein
MSVPLRIHPENPKCFEFRGRPFVFVTATEHYGAVMNRPFQFERYLKDAADKHMTLSRLFCLFRELQSPVNPYSTCKPESPDYVAPYPRTGPGRACDGQLKFDLDRWNPEFFERLHRFLSLASKCGIVVEVVILSNTYEPRIWELNPLHARNNVNHLPEISWTDYTTMRHDAVSQRQAALVRKIVEEANPYDNVIFEICNEPGGGFPGVDGAPSPDEVDAWQTALAKIIRDTESALPNQHLIAGHEAFVYHPWDHKIDKTFGDSFVDIVNIHPLPGITYGGVAYDMGPFMSKKLHLRSLRDFCLKTYHEPKPLNLDEDNAASQYKDLDGWTIHRKRAWTALLSGAHYDYIDFSIINYCEAGTPASRAAIRSWMKHISMFMDTVDIIRAKPLAGFLREQPSHTCESVMSVSGEDYVIYLADERELDDMQDAETTIRGDVAFDVTPGSYRVSVFSPTTGLSSPAYTLETDGPVRLAVPEFQQDIVVRLQSTISEPKASPSRVVT